MKVPSVRNPTPLTPALNRPARAKSTRDSEPRTFDLPFPREEYEERYTRVRHAMLRAEVDVALVSAPRDFHWLTGGRVDFWASESPQWA